MSFRKWLFGFIVIFVVCHCVAVIKHDGLAVWCEFVGEGAVERAVVDFMLDEKAASYEVFQYAAYRPF